MTDESMTQANAPLRKFQCFVCDAVLADLDEFRRHITANHEEGREFILCPLSRCRCPVRDLKAHYKRCHPSEKFPKGVQHRCLVFRDLRNPNANNQRKTPRFKQGTYISKKNGEKPMTYRSSYELEVYKLLERDCNIEAYEVEPFTVEYFFKGKTKHYWPDLRVKYVDGRIEVWEIKPQTQKKWAVNEAKWAYCDQHCVRRGWLFRVLDEEDIRRLGRESG